MSTLEFLSQLRRLDVKVWAEGNKLRYRAPESALSPQVRDELVARKTDILLLLHEMKERAQPTRSPIIPVPRDGVIPLSFSQQRMWFLNQLEPESAFYNISVATRLSGLLDVSVLEKIFNEIQLRHESLRTTFGLINGEPGPLIRPAFPESVPVIEISPADEKEREADVQRRIKAEFQRPFDLSKGPLMRVTLLRLKPDEHIVAVTMHHIISDGWSMGVLLYEVGALYRAFVSGNPSPLPALPIQYADYAHWQRRSMNGEVLEEKLRYWKQKLMGAPPILELPADRPRPAMQSYRGRTRNFYLSAELLAQIRTLNRANGTTLFMALAAAFNVLLSRYNDCEDIVIGTDVAGRDQLETEGLIGFFANMLALRTNLSGDPSFAELLARVREVTLEAYAHRDLPFDLLVAELQGDRNLSHTPIVQVVFTLQNYPMLTQSDLNLSPVAVDSGVAKFDLGIEAVESEQGLTALVEFSTDLFDEVTVCRLFDNYRTLLADAAARPHTRISALRMLTDAEREQLLTEWNRTQCEFAGDRCLHELIEAQVERTPDNAAVVFQNRRLTYRELNARANRLARVLVEQGVGPEVLVALLAERGADFLITMLAVFKAGGAYIPLDPHHPAHRTGQVLGRSGAELVITASRFRAQAAEAATALTTQRPPRVLSLEELLQESRPEENLGRPVLPNQLAYVIFTSGSTGAPKGAMVEHRGMLNHLHVKIRDLGLTDEDIVAQTASQCFDISVWQFLAALLVGGEIHIFDDETTHDPARLLDQVEQSRVSIFELVPSLLRMMLEVVAARSSARPNLSRLRWLIPTGEALPPQVCRQWLSIYPEIPLLNAYGPTECSDDVTHHPIFQAPENEALHISIGRPVTNMRLYVLDSHLQPKPIGGLGELYVGGIGVGRGYLDSAERTAEVFIPDPFAEEPGARLYKTGDLARYLQNGNIEFLGRLDHQVKVHGFRIELGEIEAALADHPAIRESLVVTYEEPLGEEPQGEKRLVAYIVPQSPYSLTGSEIRSFLKQRLPKYMVPSSFVILEKLPLTSNGKIDRQALPAPDHIRPDPDETFVPPRTTTEIKLTQITARLLRLDRVGIQDNFFELGGHSLLAMQLISRVREAFSVELPLRILFETATVAELAESIDRAVQSEKWLESLPIEPISREGKLPLSFAQQRLWFLDQLEPGNPAYNIHITVRLLGALNIGTLERSFSEILRRHEALRTTFDTEAGHPVQRIAPFVPIQLPVTELTKVPAAEHRAEVERLAKEESGHPFDLAAGPLLRIKLLRLGEQEYVALLTMHHIVSDGWSMGILLHELSALYRAFSADQPSPLEELPIQYADFAAWQRQWLQGETLERQLSYWKEQLSGIPPLLALPTFHPRPAVQSMRGARTSFSLPPSLSAALKALGQREGVTLFMTLLAAFKTLLYRYTGQSDIIVGSPIAGRGRIETEGLIGFFVNTLVLRTNLSGDPSLQELLGRVREVALEAQAHQDMPFEKLVEELQPERNLSYSPLFQVMFVLQNAPMPPMEVPGLSLSPLGIENQTAKFDLSLLVEEGAQGVTGELEYSTDLFDEGMMSRLLAHFQTLLEGAAADPDRRISALPLLSSTEREELVFEWNRTHVEYPRHLCLHQLVEAQVEHSPDAVAVVYESEPVTYADLNARSNRLAHYLQAQGVGPEVLVGVCLERSIDMVIALLAALKAGGAYVPLDPDYPQARLAYMLEDAAPRLVLTHQSLLERLPSTPTPVLCLDQEWESRIAPMPEDNPESVVCPENAAYVIYTSGSTGWPKGAINTHAGICNRLQWMQEAYCLNQTDCVLQKTPYSFDVSVWEFFWPLLAGARIVVARPGGHRESAYLVEIIAGQGVTVTHFVPSMLSLFLEEKGLDRCAGLRLVISSGEALSAELQERCWARLGAELHNLYGPTEASVDVSSWACRRGEKRSSVPIGRPISNLELYVLDQRGEPAPVGVAGELHIGGVGLGRGYLKRSDLTAEKFIPHPYGREAGARLYMTGDLARYLPDGAIEYLGRIDHQVKLHGLRIELGEIEAALEQHPGVRESVVMAREDHPGDQRLVGYVVAEAEQEVSRKGLREHLKERLPEHMVPGIIIFLKEMPLNTNGKVDRKQLPAPGKDEFRPESAFVPPRTPVEESLASVWSQVLRLQRVGIYDNFFELGGDSILSIQIVARAHQAGLRLTPRQLFQYQTIAELATVATMGPAIQAEQGIVTGPLPLTPIQRWFFEQNLPDPHHFNQAILLETHQALNASWLEPVIQQLLAHHDALRLRFKLEDVGWKQEVAGLDELVPFSRIDLSNLSASEQELAIEAAAAEFQTTLNLSHGPLLRVGLIELGDRKPNRLLLVCHHLVIDGVSWRILLEDLMTAYQQLSKGEAIELPPKTTSFKYWAQRLSEYAQSETLRQERPYWSVEPGTHLHRLPIDYPEGVNIESSTRTATITLSVEETEALLTEVPKAYRTQINDILLTALTQTLAQWVGTRSILVDLEGHGREEIIENVDLSRTVGWFTTLFPVLLVLGETSDPEKTLKSVKEQLRRIPKHGIGYGLLRYLSEDEESAEKLENTSQAEVIFNYLGQLDQTLHESSPFRLAQESTGPVRSQRGLRRYLLEIDGGIAGNQFQLTWSYSENIYRQSTIESVAKKFIDTLRSLIAHCLLPESGGYTPSDFPLAKLDQQSLDHLPRADRRVEDLYPLSPAQHGMLFDCLYAPTSGVYVEQLSCDLHGVLDIAALKRAWDQVVNKHPILRSAFIWDGLEAPLQMVYQHVALPWEEQDWRELSANEQEAQLAAYLKASRFRGFDLSEPPLMRLTIMRLAEEAYHFIWTSHHLLFDGWCLRLIFEEVIAYYTAFCQGQEIYLKPRRPYRDYIAWLQQQDLFEVETFWRRALKGFTTPTLLSASFETAVQSSDERGYDEQQIHLSETITAALQSLARQHQLTLNTVVRGTWALLLNRYSGEDDVVFGAVVSGRPPTLQGVESMLGLFASALPVRVQISPTDSILDWLRHIQANQVEMQQYEYSSLARVQQWSEVPPGAPLFDSLLVFENYPNDSSLEEQNINLKVGNMRFLEQGSYPITLMVAPGSELLLKAIYDRQRFDRADITQILKHLRLILEGFVTDFEGSIATLPIITEEENELLSNTFTLISDDYSPIPDDYYGGLQVG